MQKLVCILLAALGVVFSAEVVSAKVYWLPDFLGENADRNSDRVNSGTGATDCPSGYLKASEVGNLKCTNSIKVFGVGTCYGGCYNVCDRVTDYADTAACQNYGCQKTYAECSSKCESCYSDNCRNRDDNVINSEWGCQTYWSDCSSKCEVPYADNCHNREDNLENEEWGCQQAWSDCAEKCEVPYTDNCHQREDNTTDYGCQKYWADCPTKCELGKTCVPTDCSAYPLTTPPANALYEECSVGCGDTGKHYRFVACKTGFYDKQSFICANQQICTWSIQ